MHDEETNRVAARLLNNQDFLVFMRWLEDQQAKALSELLEAQATPVVHQLQGEARMLANILQSVRAAPLWLASNRSQ
jgi:hypothetical protein